jgi:hypothetical protein
MQAGGSVLGWVLRAACGLMFVMAVAHAAEAKKIDCELRYSLAGWSAFYKTAKGQGKITCDNGQTMRVAITVKGGGVTFGKTKIEDGHGKFSEVSNINDLLGGYAEAGVEAGAVKSTEATVLTNGTTTLALAGKGEGWSLGVSGAKFTIRRK